MTEILNKEFSRKSFVKGGGAMIVGFSVAGALVGAKTAKGAIDPYASMGPYDQASIDAWITIHADNTATIKIGKVELGQGTLTGLLMVAGEELDLSMKQLKYVNHDTHVTPNQGSTVGSQGIQTGGLQTRAAAVAAKSALLDLAAVNLGVAKASLTVKDGVVSGGGKTVTYGALIGDKLFNVQIPGGTVATPAQLAAGGQGAKPISQYTLAGTHGVPRVDIPAKVNGTFTYVHNVKVPGMLHGRLVRPRGQGAYGGGTAPEVVSVDEKSIKHIAGAQVIRYKNFVGVVAPTEYAAIQAGSQLKVKFATAPPLQGVGNLFKQMREHDSAGKAPARIAASSGNFDNAFASAPITVSQAYKYHYTGHLPIGPSCCVADVTKNGARIFTNTQDAYGSRSTAKTALDTVWGAETLPLNRIRVTYYEGGSVYGSSPYQDAVQGATIMSAMSGKPVRLQFMRWDEHGWDNYGPAQLTDVRGGVDANGNLTAFEFSALAIPQYSTQAAQQQITGTAAYATAGPLDATISGTQYNVPNRKLIGKSLPLQDNYFKVSFLRAPNALQSAFAAEQLIDELAYAAKMDPMEFRTKNVATATGSTPDPSLRWKNVITNVAKISNWKSGVAASNLSNANVVTGRGVSFGFYANTQAAAVVDVEVNKKTGKIVVQNVFCCTDAGFIVYPDGMHSNEEGAIMQGISRAIHEQVSFDKGNVTSLDWVTYPMLRFKDSPKIVIDSPSRTDVPATLATGGSRTTGAGEPGLAPMAAAIANAFFDATGVRIREAPMSPARVRAVLKAAGK